MKIKIVDLKEIWLYALIFVVFSLGTVFNFSWKIGWSVLMISTSLLILFYIYHLLNKKIIFDKFLFLLGVFIFIILEPYIFLLQGSDFPFIDNRTISDNYVANKTGVIASTYILFFYIGRIIASYLIKPKVVIDNNKNSRISLFLLSLFILIAVSPFFIHGADSFINNFLNNIVGRSTGNIGFTSVSIGSTNPVIVLLGAAILPTIILTAVYAMGKNILVKALSLLVSIGLIFIYASLGGNRSKQPVLP